MEAFRRMVVEEYWRLRKKLKKGEPALLIVCKKHKIARSTLLRWHRRLESR